MTTLNQTQFEALFRNTPRTFPEFHDNYHNGTGYLDPMVSLNVFNTTKTADENDRRIVVIPLAVGENLVIFERYPNDQATIAFNAPHPRTSKGALEIHKNVIKGHAQRFDDEFTIVDLIKKCKEYYK